MPDKPDDDKKTVVAAVVPPARDASSRSPVPPRRTQVGLAPVPSQEFAATVVSQVPDEVRAMMDDDFSITEPEIPAVPAPRAAPLPPKVRTDEVDEPRAPPSRAPRRPPAPMAAVRLVAEPAPAAKRPPDAPSRSSASASGVTRSATPPPSSLPPPSPRPTAAALDELLPTRSSAPTVIDAVVPDVAGPARPQRGGPPSDEFPAGWDRYESLGLIGRGVTGTVYKAYDPRNRRMVALKFLGDSNRGAQLLREASSQGKIDHPQVCKVFEVSEVDGRMFVAMQYVDGLALDGAAKRMNFEQKLRTVALACEGVDAAHRRAILHKNLKPSNIIVERCSDGSYRPFLTDFGLQRDPRGGEGQPLGTVVGTSAFMPPEQARGDDRTLDRRVDVYSLGAILFAILAERAPYEGSSGREIVARILADEPPPLRTLVPSVPADVEAIVARAMARNPSDRYPSARSLGDDLRRYLEGQPVRARRGSPPLRLWRAVRKRPLIAGLGAVTLVTLAIVGGQELGARRAAAEQARLSRHFGEMAGEIEQRMRLAFMMPTHDVRDQRRGLRRRLGEIEGEMRAIGSAADGPGHYALGRGYQLIGDVAAAQQHLEQAWVGGNRERPVALALGELWTRLHQQLIDDGARPGSTGPDSDALKSAAGKALEFLTASRSLEAGPDELLEARILALQGRGEEALQDARAAYRRDPQRFEARVLEGHLLFGAGEVAREQGDIEQARKGYQQAEQALRGAIDVSRSDPRAHFELCRTLDRRARLPGAGSDVVLHQAADACATAARVDPDDEDAIVESARVLVAWSELQLSRGQDPTRADEAKDAVARALAIDPKDADSYRAQCDLQRVRGEYLSSRGQDAGPSFAAALDAVNRGMKLNPTTRQLYVLLVGKAALHLASMRDARAHGHVPEAEVALEAALSSLDRARVIEARDPAVITMTAQAKAMAVELDQRAGRSSAANLASALADARTAVELTGSHDPAPLSVRAELEAIESGTRELEEPPGESAADHAVEDARRAIALDEGRAASWRALALATLARAPWSSAGAPDLDEASRAIDRAIALNRHDPDLHLVKARVALARGIPSARASASEAADVALALDPKRTLGRLCVALGRHSCR